MKKRNQNSLVSTSVLDFASSFFLDLQTHHPHLFKDLTRDFITFKRRYENEGVSFVTHSLPLIGKAIYRSFESGIFICPLGYTKMKGTALPRFLGGLLKCCYKDDGMLRADLDSSSLVDLIQLCFLFYKLDLPYSDKLNMKVINTFKKTEVELKELIIEDDDILAEARSMLKVILRGFNPKDINPRHGPGAVATSEKDVKKWRFKRKFGAIHRVYPYYEYFVPSRRSLLSRISWYKSLWSCESGCAKVTLVPKDSRGPRLISMEPAEYQFIQQGLAKNLVKHLETRSSITRGKVNFTDQNINRTLARDNSITRAYSTLDMKEASDRVSVQLVKLLFRDCPDILTALLATRTTHTTLPSGETLELSKFAPMGSALCFPVEALCFFVLAKALLKRERIKGCVYVYGDDIIVPRELTSLLFKHFPTYGLMFNEDKCFTDGYFRESCGMDAYKGIICTPIRMRKLLPRSRKEALLIVSAVELSNHLYQKGYWQSSRYVEQRVKSLVGIDVLRSPKSNFGGLSFVSFLTRGILMGSRGRVRYCKDEQSFECRVVVPIEKTRKVHYSTPDDRLFANLACQRQTAVVVPYATRLRLRWYKLYS